MKLTQVLCLALIAFTATAHAEQDCSGLSVFEDQYFNNSSGDGTYERVPNAKVLKAMPAIIARAVLEKGVMCLPPDAANYRKLEAAVYELQYGARDLSTSHAMTSAQVRDRAVKSEMDLHRTVAEIKAFSVAGLRLAELKKDMGLFMAAARGDKNVEMKCETKFIKADSGSSENQRENTDAIRCIATKVVSLGGKKTRELTETLIFSLRDYVKGGVVIHSLQVNSTDNDGEGCGCTE